MRHRPLGVGVVGCGLIGSRRAAVAAGNSGSRVVAVADRDQTRAEAVASVSGATALPDWESVVGNAEIDVVVVATTHDWLAPITIAALEHGKHVLVEKPMARNLAEAEQVLQAANGISQIADSASNHPPSAIRHPPSAILAVGFNHRYHPAIRRAHDLACAGEVGDLLFIRCRYGHGGRVGYEREWRMDPELSGGGELLDQGIHAIDLFRWFLGDFQEAFGFTSTYVWGTGKMENGKGKMETHPPSSILHPPFSNLQVEDNAFALFRSAKGQVASLHASWTQWKNLFSFEVFGERGALIVEGLGGSYGTEKLEVGRRKMEGGAPEIEAHEFPGPDRSWELEWEEFTSAIREGRQPLANGEDGLQAMRLVEAIYESTRTGRVVKLKDG